MNVIHVYIYTPRDIELGLINPKASRTEILVNECRPVPKTLIQYIYITYETFILCMA